AAGGAIENDSGPEISTPSIATITNCTFLNNLVTGGTGVTGNGGAIDNQGFNTVMHLTGCTLLNNQSVGGTFGTPAIAGEGLGGGIMNVFGVVTATGCTLSGN